MTSHGISRAEHVPEAGTEGYAREQQRIQEYNSLIADVQQKRSAKDNSPAALKLVSAALKQNPEFYTLWNYRRQILLASFPTSLESTETSSQAPDSVRFLESELQFLLPLLQSFPKCYWLWNHRLWVLHQIPSSHAPEFWAAELKLVEKMLTRDARNFHGWMYRRFVVSALESLSGESRVEEEFAYTTTMVRGVGGMKNWSAWHWRSWCAPRMLNEKNADLQERMDFLEDELEMMKDAVEVDPEDQSLWLYYRWLVVSNTEVEGKGKGADVTIAGAMDAETRYALVEEQVEWLKKLLEGPGNAECKYLLKTLIEYMALLQRLRRQPGVGPGEAEEVEATRLEEGTHIHRWLDILVRIDPMRKGRYRDMLEKEVNLQ